MLADWWDRVTGRAGKREVFPSRFGEAAVYAMPAEDGSLVRMLNVGGVSALLPLTGVPLLFISDGGSALVSAFITMGLCQPVIAKINTTELAEKQ